MKKLSDRTAVVLFQLGGPDSLESVEPFLFNLFMDPDIIDIPLSGIARRPFARLLARRRANVVAHHYEEIGGRSPILNLTLEQSGGLQALLRRRKTAAEVFVAMRYSSPSTEEAARSVATGNFRRVVLLPLYPQYSFATTLSSLHEWSDVSKSIGLRVPSIVVTSYPAHPLYIKALVSRIDGALRRFPARLRSDVDLVFSAHGVPVSFVERGDPYQSHVERSVDAVMRRGGWRNRHLTVYQSKLGRGKWLSPSLVESIRTLAAAGRTRLLIIPISFVTDHIETLHEIDIEAREEAERHGVASFHMMPAINAHPSFIACLADIVISTMSGSTNERGFEVGDIESFRR